MDTRDYEKAVKNATKVSKSLKDVMKNSATQSETNKNKIKVLAGEYASAKSKVAVLTTAFNKAAKEEGVTSERTRELARELEDAERESKDLKDQIDGLSKKADNAGDRFSKLGDALKKGLATAAKVGAAAIGAASTAIVSLTKQATENYAEYEQLVGGIETLLGRKGAKSLEEYAKMVGKSTKEVKKEYEALRASEIKALVNADKAYETAGMSANAYMETVTSFSASLLQSLGGDTQKAVDYADMAIRDMSDNANKMGTDMELIQNAYNGFAKGNFTIDLLSVA